MDVLDVTFAALVLLICAPLWVWFVDWIIDIFKKKK